MRYSKPKFMPKIILLYIITTCIVTAFSFSKYSSTLTASTNASRISIPVLSLEVAKQQEKELTIDCNTEDTSVNYEIIVSNKENNIISEVSLKYDIIITFPGEIPDGLTVKIDGNKATIQDDKSYIIENVGRFKPDKTNENTHILTIEADPDVVISSSFKDITMTVYAEQID